MKGGKLYPLFVCASSEMQMGEWLKAEIGPIADENHISSRLGLLRLRPGFHSCEVMVLSFSGKTRSGVNARLMGMKS